MAIVDTFTAPDKWYNNESDNIPLIYLAGSINDGIWQQQAIELLGKSDKKLYVANPVRTKPTTNDEEYYINIEWQIYHQRISSSVGGLMFWMNGHLEAYKSYYELGEWIQNMKLRKIFQPNREPLKLVVGIDPAHPNIDKYIRHRFSQDMPEFVIYDKLEDVCNAMLEII
jgi:Nucleoside 2-deoxyribosyltransferase like